MSIFHYLRITTYRNSDALKQLEEQDMDKVHGQLEALHRLMDKGDALGDGYQGYENKIQVVMTTKRGGESRWEMYAGSLLP